MGTVIFVILIGVLWFVGSAYIDWKSCQDGFIGKYYCPKCGGKYGEDRPLMSMVGAVDPWNKYQCRNCGHRW